MTDKKVTNEKIEQLVKEGIDKMEQIDKKESIFDKAKKALTSDTAKEVYMTLAMGILQGAIATWTFDTINGLQEPDETLIEIED